MEFDNLSIIVGTDACNARCPYCISRMTPKATAVKEVNWRNLDVALKLAKTNCVDTILLTGKGEPTLYPEQIDRFMEAMQGYDFPFIELQTNGIQMYKNWNKFESLLKKWYILGLTTIAISIVHYDYQKNRKIFTPHRDYIDIAELSRKLHAIGFSVRLACVMAKGYIDSPEELNSLIKFTKEHKIEQLTCRPVNKPSVCRDGGVKKWIEKHLLSPEEINNLHLGLNGKRLLQTPYGATVYDIDGQNVCMTNSLTTPSEDHIRQLIFFPDGHLRYDWQYRGAILL